MTTTSRRRTYNVKADLLKAKGPRYQGKHVPDLSRPTFVSDMVLRQVPVNESPGSGSWNEVRLSNSCSFGCKVYERFEKNGGGEQVVGHNSAYGCTFK